MLTINEIFHSVQGESTYAGRPCVFVRLTACDLRCSWCDTPYAFYEGSKRSLDDVIGEVDRYGCSLVEVTGGEPLLQEEVYPLMQRLLDSGKTVLLETGGHRSTERVPAEVVTILDVKCPGSGEVAKNDWTNLKRLRPKDEVKFVVKDRADYEFARDAIARHELTLPESRSGMLGHVFSSVCVRRVPATVRLRCVRRRAQHGRRARDRDQWRWVRGRGRWRRRHRRRRR